MSAFVMYVLRAMDCLKLERYGPPSTLTDTEYRDRFMDLLLAVKKTKKKKFSSASMKKLKVDSLCLYVSN